MACSSEAPKLPGAPKSETAKRDDAPATSPDPGGKEFQSGSKPIDTDGAAAPAPPRSYPYGTSPEDGVQASRESNTSPSEQDRLMREEAARRAAEAEARYRAQQQAQAASKQPDADNAAAPPPPPPPPPAPVVTAPTAPPPAGGAAPESSDDDGILSRGLGRIGASRSTTPAAEPPKAYDLVPVFYGTDRVVEPNAKRLQYGTERGHKLQLGRALITVPTIHKVPNIERPWVIEIPYFKYKIYEEKEDPAKHFTMQEIAALTKEQLLAHVKERLAKSANFKDHAFVFVHGFNTSFDAALYRTAQVAYDLKFDGAPFVYSWPSGGKVASYTYDRGSAEQAEPHLAEFLSFVVKESGAKSISLIAHSMGNEILLRVLERMRPVVPEGVVISQVILAAPDVDRDKFANIARDITSFAKGVTLYAASNDRALGYSARFWGGVPRAGDVPAAGPLIIAGVDTIDVTAVSTDSLGLNHSGYAENKTLLNDIALLLQTGERPPDKRVPILEIIKNGAGTFWRYPAGAR